MAQDKELKVKTKDTADTAAQTVVNADNEKAEVSKSAATSEAPVYEEYETTEIAKKPKKRIKKRFIVLGVVALLIIFYVVSSLNAAKNMVVYVPVEEAGLGTIENVLSISGTVQSAESKTYFSEVTAPVSSVNVKVGDKVAAGDVLLSYDESALNLAEQTADLAITQAEGSYNSMYTTANAYDREYAQGMSLHQIQDRLNHITLEIQDLKNKISEKTTRLQRTQTELNKLLNDYNENGISDKEEGYDPMERKDENGNEMYLRTQNSLAEIQYALTNDPEIISWNNQITALTLEQTNLNAAKGAYINPGQATSSKASKDSTVLTQGDSKDKISEAKEGIKADFNGVVTNVAIVEGATAANGAQLLTLENLDDVEVLVQISKSDLPKIAIGQQVDITINGKAYNGEIEKIAGAATKNNNGVAVVATTIKVKNPDSDIILGVEANNKIHAQKAENTLVLPYEYVQTDAQGDFVYVCDNGVVARKNVTIGIASSTQAQIVEGLNAGDMVITGNYDTLTEGMAVAVMPQ